MLFNEYYSEYYACVSEIISEALAGSLTQESLIDITRRKGFAESVLTIPEKLKNGSWPLITQDYGTPLRHEPIHPVTTKAELAEAVRALRDCGRASFIDCRIHKGLSRKLPPIVFDHRQAIDAFINELNGQE